LQINNIETPLNDYFSRHNDYIEVENSSLSKTIETCEKKFSKNQKHAIFIGNAQFFIVIQIILNSMWLFKTMIFFNE